MTAWTSAQSEAICSQNSNLLVSAGAGSGKTAVLAERITRLIVETGVDVDKLLVVTFTQAAAAEMKDRIYKSIWEQMDLPQVNIEHLRRQISLLNHASISTFHAFCLGVVKKYFYLTELDPDFRVGAATEIDLLKIEAVEELLAREYEEGNPFLGDWLDMLDRNADEQVLQDLLLQIYEFTSAQPYPQAWLEQAAEQFNLSYLEFAGSKWLDLLCEQTITRLAGAESLLSRARELCYNASGPANYVPVIEQEINEIKIMRDTIAQDPAKLWAIEIKPWTALPRADKETSEILKKKVQGLRNQAKDLINSLYDFLRSDSLENRHRELSQLYPYMRYLCQLSAGLRQIYSAKKLEKNLVDFADLEHYALDILANPEAARDYKDFYHYIFVDEYQDSNSVQEALLNCIRRENNLFLVGDVKQSIYRFRSADPGIFLEKYHSFSLEREAVDRKINLKTNFRSDPRLINMVNCLFQHIMSRRLGEIDYDKECRLDPGLLAAETSPCGWELYLLSRENDVSHEEEESEGQKGETDKAEAEAYVVAGLIKTLINDKVFDYKKGIVREIKYRDIVILLRSPSSWVNTMEEVLKSENIPVYSDVSKGYFETLEIETLLNLLRVIDNCRQDIALMSVMRSPIFNFTTEELATLRLCQEEGSFYECLRIGLEQAPPELVDKLQKFLQNLENWRHEARLMRMDDFIWKILIESNYYYYVAAMPGGEQRQANLRLLFNRAQQFESSSLQGLYNFLRFMEKIKRGSYDLDPAKLISENENVVRIMSVHKSKGLEFPVVIMAGLGRQFNLRDINAPLLLHKELGLGPRYVDLNLRAYRDTLVRQVIKEKIRLENLSEEMRVLYVACTRAQNRLLLVGTVGKVTERLEHWKQNISPWQLAGSRNYLDWIGPVFMRHEAGQKLAKSSDDFFDEGYIPFGDDCSFKLELIYPADIKAAVLQHTQSKQDIVSQFSYWNETDRSQLDSRVIQRLEWQYPWAAAPLIPTKVSVSHLVRPIYTHEANISYPDLVWSKSHQPIPTTEISGSYRGTLTHLVLQHLNLARIDDIRQVRSQIEAMVQEQMLTLAEAEAVAVEDIMQFFHSPLGQRLLKSKEIRREVPFVLAVPAHEVMGLESDESMLLQGVIDVYFAEDGGLVLIDYKTDLLTNPYQYNRLLESYRVQVKWYWRALEELTGKPVIGAYIYLLSRRKAIEINK